MEFAMQDPGADSVKGAGPADGRQPLAHAAAGEDALDPALHLLRGAPGKGEEQDAARIGAMPDEMSDTMRKRLRLAGTRPRDDQQGSTARAIERGAGLVCVEGCKTVGWRHDCKLWSTPKLKMITIRSGPPCPTSEACLSVPGIVVGEEPNARDNKRCPCRIRSHLNG